MSLLDKAIEVIEYNSPLIRSEEQKDYRLVCHSKTWDELVEELKRIMGKAGAKTFEEDSSPGYILGWKVQLSDYQMPGTFLIITPDLIEALESSSIIRGKKPF